LRWWPPSSLWVLCPQIPEEAAVVCGLNVVEQHISGVGGLQRRSVGDRWPRLIFNRPRRWLRRYAAGGLGGLADHSSKPLSCPHQMSPELEARIVEMRRAHPGWGPRTILVWLDRAGVCPLPGRSSVERCLVRHGLVIPQARKRERSDYVRWERSRAMELWQMDIVVGCASSMAARRRSCRGSMTTRGS
jgi:hypothetical protein